MIQQAVGALFVAPLAMVVEGFSFPLTWAYLIMILYLSIFASGIASCLWLYLLREEDVTVLSSSSFLVPTVAVFLGWLLQAEKARLANDARNVLLEPDRVRHWLGTINPARSAAMLDIVNNPLTLYREGQYAKVLRVGKPLIRILWVSSSRESSLICKASARIGRY